MGGLMDRRHGNREKNTCSFAVLLQAWLIGMDPMDLYCLFWVTRHK